MNRTLLLYLSLIVALLSQGVRAQAPPSQANQQQASSISEKLIGAWRLISVETTRPNGEVIYPFYGHHPEGLLIYDRSGWMSVQIVSDPKPSVPTGSTREQFLKAAPAEKATAADGYYAYYGTWTVDPSGTTVTHHIQQSLYPAERGEEGVRPLTLEGNHLILRAKANEMGEDHQRKLVWERVPAKEVPREQ